MNLLSAPQRIGSPRDPTIEANRKEADFAELFGDHEPAECFTTHREPERSDGSAKAKKKRKKKGRRNVKRNGRGQKGHKGEIRKYKEKRPNY
ncbi:hypothetical protein P5V15_002615 [Pogonomyrmex californicus]